MPKYAGESRHLIAEFCRVRFGVSAHRILDIHENLYDLSVTVRISPAGITPPGWEACAIELKSFMDDDLRWTAAKLASPSLVELVLKMSTAIDDVSKARTLIIHPAELLAFQYKEQTL